MIRRPARPTDTAAATRTCYTRSRSRTRTNHEGGNNYVLCPENTKPRGGEVTYAVTDIARQANLAQ
jgi:hypothetical protein